MIDLRWKPGAWDGLEFGHEKWILGWKDSEWPWDIYIFDGCWMDEGGTEMVNSIPDYWAYLPENGLDIDSMGTYPGILPPDLDKWILGYRHEPGSADYHCRSVWSIMMYRSANDDVEYDSWRDHGGTSLSTAPDLWTYLSKPTIWV